MGGSCTPRWQARTRIPDDLQALDEGKVQQMKEDQFDKLLNFLDRLNRAKIFYRLAGDRFDALSVEIAVPGEHWEVDFLRDGEIEVERYCSPGHIDDESALAELFAKFSDEEPSQEAVGHHDAIPGK
jgi:hypothetical protein